MPVGKTSLITRCPDCATAFRATAEQLALRDGRVRCGHCGSIFNAHDNAVATGSALKETPAEDPVLSVPDAGRPDEGAVAAQALHLEPEAEATAWSAIGIGDGTESAPQHPSLETFSATGAAAPLPPDHTVASEALVLQPAPPGDVSIPAPTQASADRRVPGENAAQDSVAATANLEFDFGRRRPARARISPWLAWPLATLLLAALAAQAAFSFRGDLALLFPVVKPYAEQLCARLGCRVPLPRRAELMSIESSDLQADSTNPGVMVLSATLRNRAPFAQTPPALELTLTDTRDQPVARRVLAAADYFVRGAPGNPTGSLAANGADDLFPAGTEIPVKVFFDASAVNASGYRLYLFYP